MKILHTGDWHVGKTLQGRNRGPEYEAVLDEITEIAREQKADLVLVAGDLFDTTSPPPEAERIVYRTLLQLSQIARVAVIPGNHDNERRLAALQPLFDLARVTIRPFIGKDCLSFETDGGQSVRLALLPWLSQRYAVKADELMSKDPDQLTGQFADRMRHVIAALTQGFSDGAINILLGHVTIASGELGGGERVAQTIFDYWVDPTVFPANAHYVALGHLHKAQKMAGPCPIYYCGSPMHLDFSDKDDEKSVLLVEAAPNTPAEVTSIPLKSGRALKTVGGTLEQLRAVAGTTGDAYLRVLVKEPLRVGLGDEVREILPDAVKVIIDLPEAEWGTKTRKITPGATPRDLFGAYLAEKDIEDVRLARLFDSLYEEAHATDTP